MVAKEAYPVSPDRALQIVLEMAQPVCRLDQDRASPDVGPGELHAVFRAQVANALTKFRVHRRRTRIVAMRGHERSAIFREDADREKFLELLGSEGAPYSMGRVPDRPPMRGSASSRNALGPRSFVLCQI
jgi:hypothetical protein